MTNITHVHFIIHLHPGSPKSAQTIILRHPTSAPAYDFGHPIQIAEDFTSLKREFIQLPWTFNIRIFTFCFNSPPN